ncbi:hypothetical protein NE236_42310 [Actinoallomurus purpureus]|uniref:hypothetical protein n=1 Tax=Actinoallomurus purpureus TaxID=478114 RepID=UPI0020925AAE|nr:hypothetical protein [Actinoallomurus purpureus]MCO6011605.1 hypothetical protein [Actinoallomurus purpureus]
MSGDGTYIEYQSAGEGGVVEIPHPPVTENPHDPVHYFQGEDGRYYYSPDGEPHPEYGQPGIKKTEPPSQYKIDTPEKNESWKHEAAKGYKMHPDDLRTLAKNLRTDLNDLKYYIQQKAVPDMSGTGAMGSGYAAAEDYEGLARSSSQAFSTQWNAVISTYENIITLLTTTADNGQNGEDDTHHAVKNHAGNKAI